MASFRPGLSFARVYLLVRSTPTPPRTRLVGETESPICRSHRRLSLPSRNPFRCLGAPLLCSSFSPFVPAGDDDGASLARFPASRRRTAGVPAETQMRLPRKRNWAEGALTLPVFDGDSQASLHGSPENELQFCLESGPVQRF
ncbi:uncharacterized protein LOC123409377 [Hordeum vulgare subsp. vulgare]|uniref:uncharacterized protein LOC123409377 n=1 Tax=Hordeum vulgare subsp. vulgare TaxID=112509 RepID=UPI001D1A4711|nr:uncharacterized protein LOC123409377 [Hordeum vulgare subsp. vulgare]